MCFIFNVLKVESCFDDSYGSYVRNYDALRGKFPGEQNALGISFSRQGALKNSLSGAQSKHTGCFVVMYRPIGDHSSGLLTYIINRYEYKNYYAPLYIVIQSRNHIYSIIRWSAKDNWSRLIVKQRCYCERQADRKFCLHLFPYNVSLLQA